MCRVINWIANSKIYSKPIEITAASTDVINLNTKKKENRAVGPKGGAADVQQHTAAVDVYIFRF